VQVIGNLKENEMATILKYTKAAVLETRYIIVRYNFESLRMSIKESETGDFYEVEFESIEEFNRFFQASYVERSELVKAFKG
jgi:hypothetical protein